MNRTKHIFKSPRPVIRPPLWFIRLCLSLYFMTITYTDENKFIWLMSSEDKFVIMILYLLLSDLFEKRKELINNNTLTGSQCASWTQNCYFCIDFCICYKIMCSVDMIYNLSSIQYISNHCNQTLITFFILLLFICF